MVLQQLERGYPPPSPPYKIMELLTRQIAGFCQLLNKDEEPGKTRPPVLRPPSPVINNFPAINYQLPTTSYP